MKRLLNLLIVFAFVAAFLPATTVEAQLLVEILKPTANTITGNGIIINPGNAYDGSTGGLSTTFNQIGVGDNNDNPTIEYHTWQTPSHTHTARRLYIRREGTGNTNDTWSIWYSTNGGTNYTAIESGLINPTLGNTSAVTIDTGLALSNLWVKIVTAKSGSDDGGSAHIYDVWLEGDTPDSYGFGAVAESSTKPTGLTYFMITNNSTSAVNITIGGTDMTGGDTWILSNDASVGENLYGLKAGLENGGYDVVVRKDGPYNTLVSGLTAGGKQKWGLQLLAPSIFTDSAAKSATVTLTATAA